MLMPAIFGDTLFDGFFDDFARPAARPAMKPHVPGIMKTDIKEAEDAYELDIELPGYNKDDVKAELKNGFMTIKAETKSSNDEKDENGKFLRKERYYGSCSRSFYVGEDVKKEDIKAKFENGILKIQVPKIDASAKVEENKYIAIEG